MGRYELVERLGRGPFTETWRAVDEAGRPVALKVATDEAWAAALRRRGRGIRVEGHPNVAAAIEIDVEWDPPFAASALVPGRSLRRYLVDGEPLPPLAAVRILQEIVTGLERIHSSGVVHGALKSKDVVLGEDGRVVLSDVEVGSLSRDLTVRELGDDALAARPELAGLVPYLPPDGAQGPGADLYAAGVVLFEMLTGRTPEPGEPGHGFPPPLEGVLSRLTGPPGRRFQSAGECLAALEAIDTLLPDEPIQPLRDSDHLLVPVAEPPPTPDPAAPSRPAARRRSVRLRQVSPDLWQEVDAPDATKPELTVDVPSEDEAEAEYEDLVLERKIVRYKGTGSRRVRIETARGYLPRSNPGAVVFPGGLVRELAWCFLVLAGLLLAASLAPGFLEAPRGVPPESVASTPVKPEWYFLPLYQLSNVAPSLDSPVVVERERMALLLTGLGGALLVLLPFWERSRGAGGRWLFHPLVFGAAATVVALGVWGQVHPRVPGGLEPRAYLGGVAGSGLVAGLAGEAARQRKRGARTR